MQMQLNLFEVKIWENMSSNLRGSIDRNDGCTQTNICLGQSELRFKAKRAIWEY